MSKHPAAIICDLAIFTLLAGSAFGADSVAVVNSAASQGANDSVVWSSQLGVDGTLLGASLSVHTTAGATVQATMTGANSIASVVCPSTPCSWNGAGFVAGDSLLWTSNLGNGGNGPVTFGFSPGISGAGALLQSDGPGPFTAKIEAFNGATSLGSFTVSSNANGDATYIGIKDLTAPNITSVVFSLTSATGNLADFAIDTLNLNTPPAGPAVGLSQAVLNFGNQTVGIGATQSFILSNSGSTPLTYSSIITTGDYSATSNCVSPIAASNSCTVTVTFLPTTTGTRPGTVTITDNASGSPHQLFLTGTGVVATLTITVSHVSAFAKGQSGASYTILVSNTGLGRTVGTVTVSDMLPAGLTLASMSGPGWTCPGSAASNCTRSDALAPGASYPPITVMVNVTPTAASPQVNAAAVAGGGSLGANATDSTQITTLPSLTLPSNVTVPPGNTYVLFPVTLSAPATDVVFVTLTSSDPTKVGLTQAGAGTVSFSIQPGQTAPSSTAKVFGVDFGSSTITATAVGYSSASQTVLVRGTVTFVPNPVSINPGSNKKVSILLSGPSPSGVTVNLAADNPSIAGVQPTVTFGPGVTSVVLNVNGLTQGSTLIHASVAPFIPDSTVTIIVGNPGPPVVTTASLPDGQVGLPYSQTLTATGGIVPLKWSLLGGQLPNGLSLDPSGIISGTPTVTASATPLTFKVTDATSPTPQSAQVTLTLTINFQGALTVTSSSLPNGTVNSLYSATLTAAGGTTPYHWLLLPGNQLPNGLSLNGSSGVISGTPTAMVANLSLAFQVTDSSTPIPQTAMKTLSLTIGSSALVLTTTSLADGVINKPYSQQLQAIGGAPPYTWSIISSRLPSNYFLNAATGMITSDTGTCCVGTFQPTFQVADSQQHTATATLFINIGDGSLQLITTSLPNGQVGVPYSVTLMAKGGTLPYNWTLGGLLPNGLTFNAAAATISGTPTTTGSPRLQVMVTDASTPMQGQNIFLNLTVTSGPPVITTSSLPGGGVGNAYSASVIALGGTTPYTWSATNLPTGLSINASTGAIGGTPTTAGTSQTMVTVTDSTNPTHQTATAPLPITISPPAALAITTMSLPTGAMNTPYSAPVTAAGGATPYSWSASGLPVGLTINVSTGVITGTPTTAGSSTAVITVMDSSNPTHQSAMASLPITIATQALTISTTSLPGGTSGLAYSATVAAIGGTTPYAWSATGLPSGLTIDPLLGVISGTPAAAGTSSVSVTVKDAAVPAQMVTKNFSLVIAPRLTILSTAISAGVLHIPYAGFVSITGGTPPYNFAVSGAPSNIGIGQSGAFTGAPQSTGSFPVVVTVTDSSIPMQTATANYTIVVGTGMIIIAPTIPNGQVGVSYMVYLGYQGGFAPVVWSAVGLPPGFNINPEYGTVQGVPTVAGTYHPTVTVTDPTNQVASITYTVIISP